MTLVQCHSLDTGHTETLAQFDRPGGPWDAEDMLATLVEEDHSASHVYYLTTVRSIIDD